MAETDDTELEDRGISEMRKAVMEKDYYEVKRLSYYFPDGPFHRVNIYGDTVLHVVAHSERSYLVLSLLRVVHGDLIPQLPLIKNSDGNTILHELAASNAMEDAVIELLKKSPDLIVVPNNLGEKPVFYAARHGQTEMFKFLAKEMKLEELSSEERKAHLQRNDGTTVLHVSMAAEYFDLALFIVKKYPYLIEQRDQSSTTALEYLACNPTPFRTREMQRRQGFIELLNISKRKWRGELLGELFNELFSGKYEWHFSHKKSNGRLLEITRLLIENDTSWDGKINNSQAMSLGECNKELEIEECSTELSQEKKGGQNFQENSTNEDNKKDESALFLATKSNIQEIVKEVLYSQPQALQHTNKEGMNMLHVAILYRHIDIFDMVIKHELLAKRLLSVTDHQGNSILHMVSKKRKSQASEKMQNPALQLRDELLLFEKVKSACKNLVINPLNKDKKTAEELFAAANEQLHQDAKEWLMRTTENCTMLSVFIATVAFAAIYTAPGGPDQNTGYPMFRTKPFFLVFTIADLISLALALTSVGILLSILTSSFPLQDFKMYLFKKLIQGIVCMVLSVSMMAVAFGATIVLMMSHNQENVFWSVVAFLPVPIFFLSYSPLRSAVLGPFREGFKSFVVFFLMVVCLLVLVLFYITYVVYKGLSWRVKKACSFIICKPLSWNICGIKSKPDVAGSSQPTAAALPKV